MWDASFLQDIIRGAAEEVLAVLKNDKMKDNDKKKEIEELLGDVTSERFAQVRWTPDHTHPGFTLGW